MVRARAKKGDTGSVLSGRAERGTAETNRGSVRGHVGALPAEHRTVGSQVPDRLRQVPHPAARQCGGGRSAAREFFRQGVKKRGLIKGKRWLLLSRWKNLAIQHRGELNRLFKLNRRVFKAYLLKESLERLWDYRYEGAMLNYLQKWMDQLKWQRLRPFEKLADMLLNHLEGILNYCRMKVPMGVVEAVNGNIKSLLRRGRGYSNLRYLLLTAQRMTATKTEFIVFRKA